MSAESVSLVRRWRSPRTAAAVSLALILLVVVVDLLVPANIILPILFAVPLVIYAWVRSPRLLWGMALVLVALNFLSYWWGPPATQTLANDAAFLNRAMAAVTTLAMAGFLHQWILAERELEAQRLALEKQNDELETVNQKLGQREEEIVRQNEELQSQTEELVS